MGSLSIVCGFANALMLIWSTFNFSITACFLPLSTTLKRLLLWTFWSIMELMQWNAKHLHKVFSRSWEESPTMLSPKTYLYVHGYTLFSGNVSWSFIIEPIPRTYQGQPTNEKIASFKTFWKCLWNIPSSWKSYHFLPLLSPAWNQSASWLDGSPQLGDSSDNHHGWQFPCQSHQDAKTRSGHCIDEWTGIYGGRWEI